MKLAEALAPELPPDRAEAVLSEYLGLYNSFYLENMRRKLGLLKRDEPEDEMLITELLQTMHNTGGTSGSMGRFVNRLWCHRRVTAVIFPGFPLAGADFTNTFRGLSRISCPTEGESEEEEELVRKATALLLEQCASLEELKAANKPAMDPR